jgi:recombinational DNA repair protein RecT
VRENDEFQYEYGLQEKLRHVPALSARGDIKYVYAYATFTNGGYAFVVLSKADVDFYRSRSKASDTGPWTTDYEAMAQKTAVRRLAKWLPLTVEFAKAVALDEIATNGQAQNLDLGRIDPETGEIPIDAPVEEAEVVETKKPDPTPEPAKEEKQEEPKKEEATKEPEPQLPLSDTADPVLAASARQRDELIARGKAAKSPTDILAVNKLRVQYTNEGTLTGPDSESVAAELTQENRKFQPVKNGKK